MTNWTKTLSQLLHIENPPERSRRRVRQLLQQLELERSKNSLLEIQKAKLQEDYEGLENTVRELLVNEVHYVDKVKELETQLQVTIASAWSNEQLVSFSFFDRPQSHPLDQATSPIDVSTLRAEWNDEPLTGKVTQLNPATGRHDTVEIHRDEFFEEEAPEEQQESVVITLLPPGVGSVSPAHVPGMKLVS